MACLLLGACAPGHATMVKRNAEGGEYALHGPRAEAMRDAKAKMQADCRGPYTITQEEMVKEGVRVTQSSEADILGNTTATKKNITAMHLTYKCGAPPSP